MSWIRELIDRVLARGADMAPLLTGVLNLYGEDLLDDVDDALVARSLALARRNRRSRGDARVWPASCRWKTRPSAASPRGRFSGSRFASPAEALQQLRQLIPTREPSTCALAQQICMMPDTPGRTEALLAIDGGCRISRACERAAGGGQHDHQRLRDGRARQPAGRAPGCGITARRLPAEARKELKNIRKQLKTRALRR